MAHFVIQGGRRLAGRFKPAGNKNAVLPMLAASVLTDEPVVLRNIPIIDDVLTGLALLHELGVQVDHRGHTVTLCARGLRKYRLHADLCRKMRSSILFAGPLAARHGRATVFPPGGDMIGRRPLDTHFDGLRRLGIQTQGQNAHVFRRKSLKGADILLDEASVTATENIVMAATLAEGTTTIFNAACEPHVQDLCHMLNRMGARIRGIGTNHLAVHGVERLSGVRHRVSPDYIEAASVMTACLLTGGALDVAGVDARHLAVFGRVFQRLGVKWSLSDNVLHLPADQKLRVRNAHGPAIPKIEDGPWPSFPSDLMSIAIVMAAHARGTLLFFEKMFESRMYFVDRLIDMGARIIQCDPHRVIVSGPAQLSGSHVSSPDIRAGMALLLAALCARGESTINNAESIDRGYQAIDRRLRALGADIVRED